MSEDLKKDFDQENESVEEKLSENSSQEKDEQKNDDLNDSPDDSQDDSLIDLQKKNDELESKYKRALADYQNLLRSSAEEKKELLKYSLEGFLLEILPIYDNLNTSIHALDEDQSKNPWVEGVKYTIKQFDDFFSRNGIEKIKTVGEKFDYNSMEAVEGEGDYVVKELRPGYKLKDKIIIPARIVAGSKNKN